MEVEQSGIHGVVPRVVANNNNNNNHNNNHIRVQPPQDQPRVNVDQNQINHINQLNQEANDRVQRPPAVLAPGNQALALPVIPEEQARIITYIIENIIGGVAHDNRQNQTVQAIRLIDPFWEIGHPITNILKNFYESHGRQEQLIHLFQSENMEIQKASNLAKRYFFDFDQGHHILSCTSGLSIIKAELSSQQYNTLDSKYRFLIQQFAQLYWFRLEQLINRNIQDQYHNYRYVKGMMPQPVWQVNEGSPILWASKTAEYKMSRCYFEMIQIANLLIRSLFKMEEVTTAAVQGNNALLQGVIAAKDFVTGGYLIYKQSKYNKFGQYKRKETFAKRIVKKVTRHNKDIATDEELKLINKQTFIPFKVITLVTMINEVGGQELLSILQAATKRQGKKQGFKQLNYEEIMAQNIQVKVDIRELFIPRNYMGVQQNHVRILEKQTRTYPPDEELVQYSKWEIEAELESRSKQLVNALFGYRGDNNRRRRY